MKVRVRFQRAFFARDSGFCVFQSVRGGAGTGRRVVRKARRESAGPLLLSSVWRAEPNSEGKAGAMSEPPARPKIYHITHVDNLASLVADGVLLSDAEMIKRGGPKQAIGMSAIKRRRVEELEVATQPGTKVGDYVPFYFCPRSVMLFVIYRGNHPELTYRGGQGPIVHLEADLRKVTRWADENGVRWAFSLSNAGAYYTEFRSNLSDLNELDWDAIAATQTFGLPMRRNGSRLSSCCTRASPSSSSTVLGCSLLAVQLRATQALTRAAS